MTFDEYQDAASTTNRYPMYTAMHDLCLGLCSEAGEVAGKLKKIDRDFGGVVSRADEDAIAHELGDVMWYVSQIAARIGYGLEDVAKLNVEKLKSRAERGVIAGSGDDR